MVIREEFVKLVFRSITRARSMKRLSYNLRIIQDLSFQTLTYGRFRVSIMIPSNIGFGS